VSAPAHHGLCEVNKDRSSRVVIDIVRTTGTVSGRMAVGEGASTEFFGWLELIDRLQSVADTPTTEATMELYATIRRRGWRSGANLDAAAAHSTHVGEEPTLGTERGS